MILEGYGIKLERLTAQDLELVRVMRNADVVRLYMHYQEIISPKEQVKWFETIDNANNNYFLIHHEKEKVGMISGAEIDWLNMETKNGGLFIWEPTLWGTTTPLLAALVLTELSFRLGFKKNYIRVLPQNTRATEFNSQLGYIKEHQHQYPPLETYSLVPERFFQATEKLR